MPESKLTTSPNTDVLRPAPLRFLVHDTGRDNQGRTVCSGVVAAGVALAGDRVRVLPSGRQTHITGVLQASAAEGPQAHVIPADGASVVLELGDALELVQGDVIAAAAASCGVGADFDASLVVTGEAGPGFGRELVLHMAGQVVAVRLVSAHPVDEVTHVLHLARPIVFDLADSVPALHEFLLLDASNQQHVADGRLLRALRKSENIHVQSVAVTRSDRAMLKRQKPCVVWFTGLSAAGKSTISNLVELRLLALGRHSYLLDGDNVRHGLSRDLGFSDADRTENIRRIAEVARLMVDAGLIVLVAFISPFRADRAVARSLVRPGEFIEVFVDVPLALAEQRDPKGLYGKARRGELKGLTGVDSPYEAPLEPEVRIPVATMSAEAAADHIVDLLLSLKELP